MPTLPLRPSTPSPAPLPSPSGSLMPVALLSRAYFRLPAYLRILLLTTARLRLLLVRTFNGVFIPYGSIPKGWRWFYQTTPYVGCRGACRVCVGTPLPPLPLHTVSHRVRRATLYSSFSLSHTHTPSLSSPFLRCRPWCIPWQVQPRCERDGRVPGSRQWQEDRARTCTGSCGGHAHMCSGMRVCSWCCQLACCFFVLRPCATAGWPGVRRGRDHQVHLGLRLG